MLFPPHIIDGMVLCRGWPVPGFLQTRWLKLRFIRAENLVSHSERFLKNNLVQISSFHVSALSFWCMECRIIKKVLCFLDFQLVVTLLDYCFILYSLVVLSHVCLASPRYSCEFVFCLVLCSVLWCVSLFPYLYFRDFIWLNITKFCFYKCNYIYIYFFYKD